MKINQLELPRVQNSSIYSDRPLNKDPAETKRNNAFYLVSQPARLYLLNLKSLSAL